MKFMNRANLPESIVRAVKWSDRPEPQAKSISVTTLLRPPQMRALEKIHDAEIETDVADGLWRLLGSAVHSVLERANEDSLDDITEQRFYWPFEGWRLNGQVDLIEKGGILNDYKITSTYSFLLGEKQEWVQQLQLYRWLAEMNGQRIQKLQIVAILRDWQSSKVSVDEPDYPKVPMIVVPIEMWPMEKTEAFIRDRLAAHEKSLIDPSSIPCTPEERWERAGKFAVMEKGKKRSMRNLDTREEAESFKANVLKGYPLGFGKNVIPSLKAPSLYIEERPTLQRRCESYCNVQPWCPQAKALGVVKR